MTSPHSRLHKYFLIRRAGTPSTTVELDGITSDSAQSPPEWLVRHCEVGDAIAGLKNGERAAVENRWYVSVLIEECERALRVVEEHKRVARRQRSNGGEWVHLGRDAKREMDSYREMLRYWEGKKEYHDGMHKVCKKLGEGG